MIHILIDSHIPYILPFAYLTDSGIGDVSSYH